MSTKKLTLKLTEDQRKQFQNATGQSITELSIEDLDQVVGGTVAVKTISWSHDDESPKETP